MLKHKICLVVLSIQGEQGHALARAPGAALPPLSGHIHLHEAQHLVLKAALGAAAERLAAVTLPPQHHVSACLMAERTPSQRSRSQGPLWLSVIPWEPTPPTATEAAASATALGDLTRWPPLTLYSFSQQCFSSMMRTAVTPSDASLWKGARSGGMVMLSNTSRVPWMQSGRQLKTHSALRSMSVQTPTIRSYSLCVQQGAHEPRTIASCVQKRKVAVNQNTVGEHDLT